ncbi:hypothetical protein NE237_019987 [Protea cynaroides]|uniref:Reverse transcriptase RNase H-like domain-containing protein n=1 Tax=Protea cynaroides TaxID=273540 RepID=A0A9Q0K271_9MAGN|nr:hypothetical protein NE237_019987 [Protea cynaroides]
MGELAFSKKKSVTSGIRAKFERGAMTRPDISKVLSDEGATLEARLYRLEATKANGDKKITECFDSVETFEGAMKIALDGVKEDFAGMVDSLREEIDNLRVVNEDLKAKITVLERAVANGGPSQRDIPKLRIPEPKSFNGTRDVKGRSVEFISALQLTKGLKKGEITYVASLREEEDMGPKKAQPQEIEAVLNEYKDIMPNELPKKQPPRRERAFDDLKQAVIDEPVMALPDHTKPFEVQTDVSNFAIGGVLMQDGHPIAYESRKLKETERRYTVQEKEMTAVVHCLRTWRHYLLGSKFMVKTDNVATSYFQSQKKLSPKQARWQDFLAEFDMVLEY